jgi:hypothetical protein
MSETRLRETMRWGGSPAFRHDAAIPSSPSRQLHRRMRKRYPRHGGQRKRAGGVEGARWRGNDGNEGVLECSGLTELWMGIERVDGKIQSGVKPPQSKKQGCAISREDAKARKGWDRVPQLPKVFWGNESVLECSGLTELWMGIERVEEENPKRCQATAVQERRIRNLTRRRGGLGKELRSCPRCSRAMRVTWSAPA